ncbi:MAG: VWA domain-containing protein [Planctomycetota bacterium]|jgi:Ca-activated chloride channel family protein
MSPLRWGDWSLLDPWFLLLLPLALFVILLRIYRPRAALPTASSQMFAGLPKTLRTRLIWAPLILKGLAFMALTLALARPVTRDVLPIRSEGVDILLLVDVSSSMTAEFQGRGESVTRIKAAREQALAFAEARERDRIGLMTFALYPDLRCPLTLDKEALAAFLRGVNTVPERSDENRTAVGVALAQAVTFLQDSEAKSRLVILLTDGENNVADILPADAAKLANDEDVRVHTIGISQPVRDFLGRTREPDFSELEAIAGETGGRFFRARSIEDLSAVYALIDEEEKVELEDPRYRSTDWFLWPLGIGVAILALALLLELFWIREVP